MPTYQYTCVSCGKDLEVVQKFTDDPLTACPHCEGNLRKVFSAVGVVFKGSGFYRTDSREAAKAGGSSNGANGKAKETAASSSGDSGGSTSSTKDSSGTSSSSSSSSSTSGSSSGSSGSSGAAKSTAA